MYKVVYSLQSEVSLKRFIDSYKDISYRLFSDTGLSDVELILENYYRAGDSLYQNIRNSIQDTLTVEQVLGRKVDECKWFFSVFISVGNFRFEVLYSEYRDDATRFIEDIEIYKK